MPRILALLLLAALLTGAAAAQVTWQKSPDNPVLSNWTGDPDDPNGYKYLLEPSVLQDPATGLYRMWFTSLAHGWGTRGCVSTAISPDGKEWSVFVRNPVLRPGGTDAWDYAFIYAGEVVQTAAGYSMYYSGMNSSGVIAIGLATSADGTTWKKYAGNPVLTVGPAGAWDQDKVAYARVQYDGAVYRMWYTGWRGGSGRAGLATSPDGVTWTKYPGNPILPAGGPGTWDAAFVGPAAVAFSGGRYTMLYYGSSDPYSDFARIGVAWSQDGVSWTKHVANPVIGRGETGSWDDRQLGGGSLLFVDNEFRFYYTGASTATGWWQIGYATAPPAPLSIDPGNGALLHGFRLSPAYPNPFNPSVTLAYDLPRDERVTLTVFDGLGRAVKTLVEGRQTAGRHTVTWEADEAASGTYWCRMQAGGYAETRPLVLIR